MKKLFWKIYSKDITDFMQFYVLFMFLKHSKFIRKDLIN